VTSPGIGRSGGTLEGLSGSFRSRSQEASAALTGPGGPRTLPNHIVVIPFPERSVF